MNAIDNSKMQKDDISLGELLSVLAANRDSPLAKAGGPVRVPFNTGANRMPGCFALKRSSSAAIISAMSL